MPPIGFVLQTHTDPRAIDRLIHRLNHLYDCPPIAWHHDHDKLDLRDHVDSLITNSSNVLRVSPHVVTARGNFSIVDATLAGLRALLGQTNPPEWIALLSGACWPIMSGDRVVSDLRSSDCDGFMTFEKIEFGHTPRPWHEECIRRYVKKSLGWPIKPWMSLRARRVIRRERLATWPPDGLPHLPFSRDFACYAGSQWWTISRRAAERVLQFIESAHPLLAHYRTVRFPDESFFQCVLVNDASLSIRNDHKRYIRWIQGAASPCTLDESDLEPILTGGAHFARKIGPESESLIAHLDSIVV
jgi:hypothetical protein